MDGSHAPLIHQPVSECKVKRGQFCDYIVRGNKLYLMVQFWPGTELSIGGLRTKALSAKLYHSGAPLKIDQTTFRMRLTGVRPQRPIRSSR